MDQIGKYRVVRIVGEGGMGRVYEATDPVIHRRVAIKTISQGVVQDPDTRARFLREAQAAGQLSHPNLITIFDVGEEGGSPFIVMEYLEGEELSRVIAKHTLSLDAKLRLMIEVCQGLAYAHSKGLVHRDIKPANIFVTTAQQVKILDFGLARGTVSEITQTGHVVGTPSYMSPEQVRGDAVDHRADIFSVGVVLYELLSGQKAFKGDSVAATIFQVLERQPDPLERLDPHLPPGLSRVVERALAKDPNARYQRIDEMLAELMAIRVEAQATTFIARPATPRPGIAPATPSPAPSMSAAAAASPAPSMAKAGPAAAAPGVRRSGRPWLPWTVAGGTAAAVIALFLLIARPFRPAAPAPQTTASPAGAITNSPKPAEATPPVAPAPAPAPAETAPSTTASAETRQPATPQHGRSAGAESPAATGEARSPTRPAPPRTQARPAETQPPARETAPVSPSPAPPMQVAPPPQRESPPPQPERPAPVPETKPAPPPPATAAPVTSPSAPPPAAAAPNAAPAGTSPAAPSVPVDPAAAIRETLARYKSALEARDLGALKQIWPGLAGRQETAIRNEFENARAIAVEIQGLTPVVTNNTAVVTCRRNYVVTTVDGRTLRTATRMTVTLNRHNGSWVIDNIRHEAER
jgi:serine/threonine-protein kinase